MVDDNFEYKDVLCLLQRFIALDKKNWELAVFPAETRGFVDTYLWVMNTAESKIYLIRYF